MRLISSLLLFFLFIIPDLAKKTKNLERIIEDETKTTVLLTLHSLQRIEAIIRVIQAYQSSSYARIIRDIIIIWNNIYFTVPTALFSLKNVMIVTGDSNSLNNRWILPIPYINTKSILIHDDDIFINDEALVCMMKIWQNNQDRIVSHSMRNIEVLKHQKGKYIEDLMHSHVETYAIATNLLLVSSKYLELYQEKMKNEHKLQAYIESNTGLCDDILFNLIVSKHSGLGPLQVLLPSKSIYPFDHCNSYHNIKEMKNFLELRNECINHLLSNYNDIVQIISSNAISTCPNTIQSSIDHDNAWSNVIIPCHELPSILSDSSHRINVVNSLSMKKAMSSLAQYKHRLGIVAMEFWSMEIDGRKGGFGFAALMVSLVFERNPKTNTGVVFLHASKRATEPLNMPLHYCDPNILELHSRPLVLFRRNDTCYERILTALNLDMIMTLDYRATYTRVIRHLMHLPVIVW